MKPLLRPKRRPNPVQHQLSMSQAHLGVSPLELFTGIKQLMGDFRAHITSDPNLVEIEIYDPIEDDTNLFNWWQVRSTGEKLWIGSADFYYSLVRNYASVSLSFPRTIFKGRWDIVAALADMAYSALAPRTMYVYDVDDWLAQNCDQVGETGTEMYGIARSQVDTYSDDGIVEMVDTRANPGYMTWWKGYQCSVQWLNYWSKQAIDTILREVPTKPMRGVELTHLSNGSVRLRLGQEPGKYNDVKFHELQLRVRKWLGWHPTMWSLFPDDSDRLP